MTYRICVVLTLLLATALVARAAELPEWDFEQDTKGWMSVDKQAELTQERDAGHVYEGAASLRFSFQARAAAPEELPGALAAGVEGLTGAKCLHLAIQSSVAGPCVIALRETDESNYMIFTQLNADEWHVLDLPLAQFRLDENSQDENGQLDPGQISGLVIADPGVFLAQAVAKGGFPFFYIRPSERTIWLDEVEFLEGCPNRLAESQLPGTVMIEDCDSDPAYFMVFGGRDLKVSSCPDPAVRGKSLRLDYTLPASSLLAAVCQTAAGALAGAKGITFSARSGAALPLLVMIEEEDRSRYQKLVQLEPGHWQAPVITWADMTLMDDSQDPDVGLQPESIRSIAFVDASAVLGQKETANTLWLDEITTSP
jgi:hypothetical protein